MKECYTAIRTSIAAAIIACLLQVAALGQMTFEPSSEAGSVELNFQGGIKLDALLNYISKRLGQKFEYTPEIGNRTVVIRAPNAVPIESLPALVSSVLRTESLVLIDSDIAGWKRVVDVKDMARFARTGKAPEVLARSGAATPVTEVFVLENVSATSLANILQPFLSENGSNLLSVPDSNVLIITDYASSVAKIAELIDIVDQPGGQATYELYEARNQDAKALAEQATGILSGSKAGTTQQRSSVTLIDQPQSNRVVVAGSKMMVEQALGLLERLDVSLGMTTEVYRIKNTTAERIDKLAKGFIEPQSAVQSYQSTIDEDGNLLVVRATAEVHRQIVKLIAEIDVPVDSSESPIQFYKLRNASAIEVLYTLLALQEAYGAGPFTGGVLPAAYYGPLGGAGVPGVGSSLFGGLPFGTAAAGGLGVGGLGVGGLGIGGQNGLPGMNQQAGGLQTTRLPLTPGSNGMQADNEFLPERANPLARPTLADGQSLGGGMGAAGGLGSGGVASLPGGARVSADISTNSLIVVAPSNVQDMYAELIKSLDQRRPQVLIEAKIIAVDTSDDFSLGVEVSIGDRTGDKRLFKFTSFGLSEVNPETGALQIIPGLGFNGTLVNPDVADVVVRALSSHRRARVLAAPKILVNDNSTGKLESVSSVPFSSVNASQTVSTTSLGGDQTAGTTITVTPHINEDDHLQLDFDVEFSTFADSGTDGLPPPRQIDRVGSTVTIPDGKTVVVGGLKRVGETDTFTGVPWAEKIPILRELTSRTDRGQQTTSFFLFIRPLILRDSRFSDLRYLSDKEAGEMCLPGDYPVSQPEWIP